MSLGLYPLLPSSRTLPGVTALLSTTSSDELWHRRLGHPHAGLTQHLANKYRLPISSVPKLDYYACNKGKSHKLPFPASATHTTTPFELIHMDVWGPSPVASFSDIDTICYLLMILQDIVGCSLYMLRVMSLLMLKHFKCSFLITLIILSRPFEQIVGENSLTRS